MKYWTKSDKKALYLFALVLIIWFSFEKKIIESLEINISKPYVESSEYSVLAIMLLFLILSSYVIFIAPKQFKNRFFIPYKNIVFSFLIVFLYFKYRLQGLFNINFDYYSLGLLDVLFTSIGLYALFSIIINIISLKKTKHINRKIKRKESIEFIVDHHISSVEEDKLKFDEKVENLLFQIDDLSKQKVFITDKSFSIGIVGKWGYGKSSYLALLEKRILKEEEKYILVKFNPRHSKSIETIQFDFFQAFFEELKEYDSRFSKSFNNYLKAIQIIDTNNLIDSIQNGFNAFLDVESEKDIINLAIQRINKKIIVIIDDLDRLLAEEIIEVFKIIDGTASFSNTVFITAFDKEHINKIIDEKYTNEETFFSDKFFNVEIFLPAIDKKIIYEFIKDILLKTFEPKTIDISKVQLDINKELEGLKYHIENNISTMRDAKRFLNSFHNQFSLVKEMLVFKEYFLLSLIKYKYYDIYLTIQKEMFPSLQYIDLNAVHNNSFNDIDFRLNSLLKKIVSRHFDKDNYCCNDKEELSETRIKEMIESKIDNNILLILKNLFNSTNIEDPKSIGNSNMFDFYFDENDNIEDYKNTAVYYKFLFDKNLDLVKKEIDNYFNNDETEKLLDYVGKRRIELLNNEDDLHKYIDLLFYINVKSDNDASTRTKLLSLFTKSFIENLEETSLIKDIEEYKKYLEEKLTKSVPFYPYMFYRDLLVNIINHKDNKEYLFDKNEILTIAKGNLNKCITENSIYDDNHYRLLLSCIEDLRGEYGQIILDEESCRKVEKLIIENPDNYFKSFVRLGMVTSDPEWNTVACDPFWKQIFQTRESLEKLIFDNKLDDKNYIDKVRNFWTLFKNNEFEPIEYKDDGVVQEKIDNDLKEDFEEFESIKENVIDALSNESYTQWGEVLQDTNPGNYGVDDIEVEINESDIIFINKITEKFAIDNVNLHFTARLGSSGEEGFDHPSSTSVYIEGDFTINNKGRVIIKNISTDSFIDLFFDDEPED